MNDIIKNLSNSIECIILGYCFLKTFRFVKIVKSSMNVEQIIIEGFVLGYIFKIVFGNLNIVIEILISILSSFVIAKIIDCSIANKIKSHLKIQQTSDQYIWHEIGDRNDSTFIQIDDLETGFGIIGCLAKIETYERFPIIQLVYYSTYLNDKLVNDFSEDPTHTILIDTSKYKNIVVRYTKDSYKIKEWQNN